MSDAFDLARKKLVKAERVLAAARERGETNSRRLDALVGAFARARQVFERADYYQLHPEHAVVDGVAKAKRKR
mgnify:CR=1 FL=1